MKIAITNVSVSGGWYLRGQQRLVGSVAQHAPQCECRMFPEIYPHGSPSHQKVPYAFKHHAMFDCCRAGYDVGIWCDSSVWLIKNPAPLIATTLERGVWISKAGWSVGEWSNDASLAILGVDRETALKIPLAMGTMYAVNFKSDVGRRLLDYLFAKEAAMVGGWKNEKGCESGDPRVLGHRHDQPVLSMFCHLNGIPVDDHPSFMAYPANPARECHVALAQGM